jgi:hypothetical protein
MEQALKKRLLRTCAWCTRIISPDEDLYAFGAKARSDLDLTEKEGEFVTLQLALHEKMVPALVTSKSSPARAEGYDLIFVTCSEACAQGLKDALEFEKDVFE